MLTDFFQWFGFGLCHQLPERSFAGGGYQLPVCARDTGIYVGFMASLFVIAMLHRGERPRGFPRPGVWLLLGVLVLLMGIDGVSSYAGWRETTNALRLATGLGVGYAAAVVVVPMLNDELWVVPGAGRVLDPVSRFAIWLATLPVFGTVLWLWGPMLGVAYPVVTVVCILGTLAALNLVIIGMIPAFDRRARGLSDLLWPVVLAVILGVAEVWLANLLRAALVAASRSLT